MRKQEQGNKVWCAFILTNVREVLASLLGVREAFNTDGKCMFPFPLLNDSLVLLWEWQLEQVEWEILNVGKSLPIFPKEWK